VTGVALAERGLRGAAVRAADDDVAHRGALVVAASSPDASDRAPARRLGHVQPVHARHRAGHPARHGRHAHVRAERLALQPARQRHRGEHRVRRVRRVHRPAVVDVVVAAHQVRDRPPERAARAQKAAKSSWPNWLPRDARLGSLRRAWGARASTRSPTARARRSSRRRLELGVQVDEREAAMGDEQPVGQEQGARRAREQPHGERAGARAHGSSVRRSAGRRSPTATRAR
jgi:hypothetical protein